MLEILHEVEVALPGILRGDESLWKGLLVDYHLPVVERLWQDYKGFRVCLHRIHPCASGEALFHPHPWPSAMRVLKGTYEMAIGYGAGEKEPPIAARIITCAGSEYEMTDKDGWHYVRPISEPTLSLMISGKPWTRPSPKSDRPLKPLLVNERRDILDLFREFYQ